MTKKKSLNNTIAHNCIKIRSLSFVLHLSKKFFFFGASDMRPVKGIFGALIPKMTSVFSHQLKFSKYGIFARDSIKAIIEFLLKAPCKRISKLNLKANYLLNAILTEKYIFTTINS